MTYESDHVLGLHKSSLRDKLPIYYDECSLCNKDKEIAQLKETITKLQLINDLLTMNKNKSI